MKIVLADPPSLEKSYDASYPNLGLLYLAGYLLKYQSDPIQIKYLGPKHTLKSHIEFLDKESPDIYGISFTSKTAGLAFDTINAIKAKYPRLIVVSGGAHPTALPFEVLDNCKSDCVVVGEGEETFNHLVSSIRKNKSISLVDGIFYRDNGQIKSSPKRPFIKNLDDIPFPAWNLIDFNEYPGMHLKHKSVESSLLISRGCPFNCSFCSNPVWKSSKPWLRHRSSENIIEEIKYLYDRGIREIYMSSDELNFNIKWAFNLCDAIKKLNYKDLYFQCNMRVDKVTKELANSLADINCWLIHIGVESGNDRILKGIGKHITVDQIYNTTYILSRANLKIFAFTMLYNVWEENGQLQWETSKEVDNTISFMIKLFKNKQIHYMSWQFATPMPGSKLYDIANKYSLYTDKPSKVWESFDEHNVTMNLPGIPKKIMKWKIKKGIILKDFFMIMSGQINIRHLWRVKENIIAILR